MTKNSTIVVTAAFSLIMLTAPADASGCMHVEAQRIRFASGAACWTYAGRATIFRGNFKAGQQVVVRMSGRADYVGMPSAWEDRVPKISGPRGFHGDAGDDNVLSTRLPYDGQYEFSFSPCSMWGNPGRVQICATHVY